jgi:CBS domain-containing protein
VNVADVMTTRVRSVRSATSLKETAALMTEHRITGLPVVEGEGSVIGVVSQGDVLRTLTAEEHAATVGDAMTAPAVTIEPTASVAEAARVMLERGINRLPVVLAGELVGILSRSDLVRTFTRSDAEIEREIWAEIAGIAASPDPRSICVEVDRGAVAVAGTVDTLEDARQLYRRATRVPGVTSVRSTVTWRREARASTEG